MGVSRRRTGAGLVAGRPTVSRIFLVTAMALCLVPLFAIPLARRILALQLPPAGAIAAEAAVVLAAIAALTLWRRFGPGHRDQGLANSGLTTPSAHDAAQL